MATYNRVTRLGDDPQYLALAYSEVVPGALYINEGGDLFMGYEVNAQYTSAWPTKGLINLKTGICAFLGSNSSVRVRRFRGNIQLEQNNE